MTRLITVRKILRCHESYQAQYTLLFLLPQGVPSRGVCGGCEGEVSPSDSLSVGNTVFHHACLTCQVCSRNMEGKSVVMDNNNRVYCTEDYARLVGPQGNTMVGVYGMEYCTVGVHGSEILDYNMEGEYKSYTRRK